MPPVLPSVQPPGKAAGRKRPLDDVDADDADATDARWVLFCCFDDPFRPVLVDGSLLRSASCRSAKMIEHQPHDGTHGRLRMWRVNIARGMLCAFLKSLQHRTFIIPKDVAYQEAVQLFDMEGLPIPGGNICPSRSDLVEVGLPSLATKKAVESAAERVDHVATLVANAIMEWPRLAMGMEACLRGDDPGFSCTATRSWVRFAERPGLERLAGDEAVALAKRRPYWLFTTLQAIGYVHFKMARLGRIDPDARDEKAFTTLARAGVDCDSAHYFLSTKRDMPRQQRGEHRDVCRHADRFANTVLATVVDAAKDQPITANVKYARATIVMAESLVREAPNCFRLFNGDCADANDRKGTPERRAFERALKARGATVLQWRDARGDAPAVREVRARLLSHVAPVGADDDARVRPVG